MAKLENYNGSVQLMAGIIQKGGGDFALIEANAIQTQEDGTRLDAELDKINDKLEELESGGANIDIDDELSTESNNPVKNKVITKRIDEFYNTFNNAFNALDSAYYELHAQIQQGKVIKSIEQTETSTEDSGTNIFTVTFTDGTTTQFEVRNGSKGADGAQGPQGDAFTYEDFTEEQLASLKGEAGYTPQKGIDYFTEEEKQELYDEVKANISEDVVIDSELNEAITSVYEQAKEYTDEKISEISNSGGSSSDVSLETIEKRLDRLESKLAPEYIVEDHETAYEKTVPYYSCNYADLEWMEGATYIDSEGHLKDAKVTQIESDCANLWNIDWIDQPTHEKTETGYIVSTNSATYITPSDFLELTGLKPGDEIITSYNIKMYSGQMPTSIGLVWFNKKGSNTQPYYLTSYTSIEGYRSIKSIIPTNFNDENYGNFTIVGPITGAKIEYSNFMIIKGEKEAPYQKYRESTIITIPEAVQNIDGYGRKNSRLNFEDKTLKVTYGEYTYTGTERWDIKAVVGTTGYYRYYSYSNNSIDYPQNKMKGAEAQDGLCDKLATHKSGWSVCTQESIRFGQGNGSAIFLYLEGDKTEKEVQDFVKGMTICYPLADAYVTTHSVDIDFDGLLPVGGTAKVRFENEDKQPVASKITYMLKEDATFE